MAKKSQTAKSLKTPKFSTRRVNRCGVCHRPRGYLGRYGLCRICFRTLGLEGKIPGVVKSSW
ncbi:type Z 30S ribosomal protein S14 [Candidatus Berkelbacteria bacterium]|nr:type Z 30S ribosomal protein S14 [Candidatus Berkelbacteria bacterium]